MDEVMKACQDEPETTVKQGEVSMEDVKVVEDLEVEIGKYRQAIADAEDALDSAEKELDQVLADLPY